MIFVKNSRGGREGGQDDQHCVKNKFVKNRGGGMGVNLNLDNVFKYTVFVSLTLPLIMLCSCQGWTTVKVRCQGRRWPQHNNTQFKICLSLQVALMMVSGHSMYAVTPLTDWPVIV